MFWSGIIAEVSKRKARGQKVNLLNDASWDASLSAAAQASIERRQLAFYSLGAGYQGIYFTRREAECMVWLLKGKTIHSVAAILNLSPRTVEYYLKNMKSKVGCRTKGELIDLVYESEFLQRVDF